MSEDLLLNLLAVTLAVIAASIGVRWRIRRHRAIRTTPATLAVYHMPRTQFRLDMALTLLAILTFAATRFIGLTDFPIYFFTDEAANTVQAAEFLHNGFRNADGQFLPTYFENNEKLSLGTTVYIQVIPYVLFGTSVFITRATSVWIALFGTIAVGLILKKAFKMRGWWVGILLLSIAPAWFLHSRTAFETVTYVSFYAWFLYCYMEYRHGRPRYLPLAMLFGALAFYSYNTGQPGLGLTGLLLLLADARYHWHTSKNDRRLALICIVLPILLAIPYLRFLVQHSGEVALRLQLLGSYWIDDLTLFEKIARFLQEYLRGLDPIYWYAPDNTIDLVRHQMKGYGNLSLISLPWAMVGAGICLRHIRSPAYRTALIAAIAAPAGSALVSPLITRVLVFVIPAVLFTAIGLEVVFRRLIRWITYSRLAVGLSIALCSLNVAMLHDALINGATWYADYGMTGLQYGAKEVFAEVATQLKQSPQTQVWIFPTWLNGADVVRRFFAPNDPRVYMLNFEGFLTERFRLSDDVLFVVARSEYERLARDPKFTGIHIERTLNLPNGTPGFYFLRLRYSPQADAIFAAEQEARRQLIEESQHLDGQKVTVRHSPFDIGSLADLFDGNPQTLVRTRNTNPAVIEIAFPQPRRLTGVILTTGSRSIELVIQVFAGESTQSGRYAQVFTNLSPDSTLDLIFDPTPGPITAIRIEVKDLNEIGAGHVHLHEIRLND